MANILFWTKVFIYGIGWWLIPIIVAFLYKRKLSRYPIDVLIYEKRGEGLVFTKDVCGRFTEPTVCYRLKISKDSIPIPDYDWILQNLSKPVTIFEKFTNLLCGRVGAITLFKYGSKQYKPIDIKVGEETKRKFKEIRDKNGNSMWVTIYEPINVKKEMSKLDFEVIDWDDINHLTQELRAIQQRRAKTKDWIERYGPTIGLAVVAMIIIIVTYLGWQYTQAAAGTYINAAKESSGIKSVTPTPAPSDSPDTSSMIDSFIPS